MHVIIIVVAIIIIMYLCMSLVLEWFWQIELFLEWCTCIL